MRGLNVDDLFEAMRLVKAANLEKDVQYMTELIKREGLASLEKVGFQFALRMIGSISDVEIQKRLYKLIGGILEESPDSIGKLDPMELYEKFVALGEYIPKEKWLSFFRQLSALTS